MSLANILIVNNANYQDSDENLKNMTDGLDGQDCYYVASLEKLIIDRDNVMKLRHLGKRLNYEKKMLKLIKI